MCLFEIADYGYETKKCPFKAVTMNNNNNTNKNNKNLS